MKRFMAIVSAASGNPYLEVLVASVRGMMQDVVVLLAGHPGSIDEAMRHHRRIRDAIAAHDAELAAREMATHVSYTARSCKRRSILLANNEPKEDPAIE